MKRGRLGGEKEERAGERENALLLAVRDAQIVSHSTLFLNCHFWLVPTVAVLHGLPSRLLSLLRPPRNL